MQRNNLFLHFTHSVMSYRFTELYAMAIPIFAPSPKFFLNFEDSTDGIRGLGPDRTR